MKNYKINMGEMAKERRLHKSPIIDVQEAEG
jgi:hypothetical protein